MTSFRELADGRVAFICKGCDMEHAIPVQGKGSWSFHWDFNGDFESPTVSPSVLVNKRGLNPTKPICHSFIKGGRIRYLNDCTHHLAGQEIELPKQYN